MASSTHTDTVNVSALAVGLNVTSAVPGRRSAVSIYLQHQPFTNASSNGSAGSSGSNATVALLVRHAVPSQLDSQLSLTLTGAVPQLYSPAAQKGIMQPAEGDASAVTAALGSVVAGGVWTVQLVNHGADNFAGTIAIKLDFDSEWAAYGDVGNIQCFCDCSYEVPTFQTAFTQATQCQPFEAKATGAEPGQKCNATLPVQGFSYTEASCLQLPSREQADLAECQAQDCKLSPQRQRALQDVAGTSAILPLACTFYANCATQHRYRAGNWSSCSDTCWRSKPDAATQPFQTRNVSCVGTDVATGVATVLPALECEAAGLGVPPPARQACNEAACAQQAPCTVRWHFYDMQRCAD